MSSRKFHRTLALSFALSIGALSLPHAGAATSRSGPQARGPAVQGDLVAQSFLEAMKDIWRLLKDSYSGPSRGQGHDPGGQEDEGSGICPHGGGPGH